MKLTLVGAGNMGQALLSAWLEENICSTDDVLVIERDLSVHDRIRDRFSIQIQSVLDEAVRESEVILFAVKPQDIQSLLDQGRTIFHENHFILSVMAGVSLERLHRELPQCARVVRVMPNVGAFAKQSMSVFCAAKPIAEQDEKTVRGLFGAVGKVLQVSQEEMIDAATAVSGSGPGYVFCFLENFLSAAQQLGFSFTESEELVRQTVRGSLALWEQSDEDVATLRARVASRGGTTEAALHKLDDAHWGKAFEEAIQAAFTRARELA